MSPKPTVQLLLTSPTVLAPGDHVKGKLIVDVVEETFELTGIYVELVGKELSHIVVHAGKSTYTIYSHFTHVQLHRTMYGASKASGKRGGALLAPGHYEFPFDFPIPYGAPPSYTELVSDGGSRIRYKVRGVLSVPLRKSIRQKLGVTVVPVVSFEQSQFGRANTLTSPEVQVPVMHGLITSKTQSVMLGLQLCPSVIVLAGTTANKYFEQQRQVAAGGGALVMGQSLAVAGKGGGSSSSDDDSDDDDDLKKAKHPVKEKPPMPEMDVADGQSVLTAVEEGGGDYYPREALPGTLLRAYRNGEESDFPLTPDPNTHSTVYARVAIANHTKKKINTFEIALRQVRVVAFSGHTRSDEVSLSKLKVVLPSEQPCLPGERVAVDVQLPIRRELVYCDKTYSSFFHGYGRMRRKTCANVKTPSFSCETMLEVTLKSVSLKKKLRRFAECVQLAEVVGVPGSSYVTLPITSTVTLELPPEALDAPVA